MDKCDQSNIIILLCVFAPTIRNNLRVRTKIKLIYLQTLFVRESKNRAFPGHFRVLVQPLPTETKTQNFSPNSQSINNAAEPDPGKNIFTN